MTTRVKNAEFLLILKPGQANPPQILNEQNLAWDKSEGCMAWLLESCNDWLTKESGSDPDLLRNSDLNLS